MSRVDDDREEARAAARLQEQRRAEQAKATRKATEATAFASKVVQQKAQAQASQEQRSTKSAVALLLEAAEANQALTAEQAEASQAERLGEAQGREAELRGALGQRAQALQTKEGGRRQGQQVERTLIAAGESEAHSGQDRQSDDALTGRGQESRQTTSRLGARYEEAREAQAGGPGAPGAAVSGERKTDADAGGGQQQGGGGKDQQPGGGLSPGFRFNPALMAPVPVAKPKETQGSERLRRVAAELAQKIVERVRVGTNAAGRVEFQVDLRSDVLAGLTVKVSAYRGQIKAVFSGQDRDVLKLIEQHGEALKAALAARGLTLEELKIEARP
jgi:hypothetical protein